MSYVAIIDDDPFFQEMLQAVLAPVGVNVCHGFTLEEGLKLADEQEVDLVLLDIMLPDGNGLDVLDDILALPSAPDVIMITGEGGPESVEKALYSGAWDYIEKPINAASVRQVVGKALAYREKKARHVTQHAKIDSTIVGSSPKMQASFTAMVQATGTDSNCLITGETGTGKEIFARAIHENSSRAKSNFVVVDCTNIPDSLAKSMLFGHSKGAFTDAKETRTGLFKLADGGTLFLDEIGDLPLETQKSLLRVLQEKHFRPIGARHEENSDFRLIAATHRNLQEMVTKGLFRRDLYYRLSTFRIALPSLQERGEDVMLLAEHFLLEECKRRYLPSKVISTQATVAMMAYPWPGNVRELQNTILSAIDMHPDERELDLYHLPKDVQVHAKKAALNDKYPEGSGLAHSQSVQLPEEPLFPTFQERRKVVLKNMERDYCLELVELARGDVKEACQLSGLSRSRLYGLLKAHSIKLR